VPFCCQRGKKLGGHAFSIDDEPPERPFAGRRFVPRDQAGGTKREVQVAAMGGCQERMALFVM